MPVDSIGTKNSLDSDTRQTEVSHRNGRERQMPVDSIGMKKPCDTRRTVVSPHRYGRNENK